MNPTKIPGANRILNPPRDWDFEHNGPCDALEVLDTGKFFQSAWVPDSLELACINAGAPVVLTIWGRQLPPASVSVMPRPGFVTEEAYQAAALALRNLLFMCRTSSEVTRSDDAQLLRSLALAESVVGEIPADARREAGDPEAMKVEAPSGSRTEGLPRLAATDTCPTCSVNAGDHEAGELARCGFELSA